MEQVWLYWGEILGVLGGAAIGARVLWRAKDWIKGKLLMVLGIQDLKKDITELSQQIGFIVDELRPNGGASIRDSLNRIELRQLLQEQRQRAILSDMAIGVFETDESGRVVWANRKFLRMSGRTPLEVGGFGWLNIVAIRDRDRITDGWHTAISESREYETEFLMITPDDDRLNVSMRTYKMADIDNDKNLGYVGMVTPLQEV